jgi:alpha-tubulin suppressor-like RCC1 family protein
VTEVLIVTKDGKVYGFGENNRGVLGLGHERQVKKPTLDEDFSNEAIIKFANGLNHVLALTSSGKIFIWGSIERRQLGNCQRNTDFHKPKPNKFLMNETIVDMNCGEFHSIVLTKDKQVYVWG